MSEDGYIMFAGGLAVPVEPFHFAHELIERGLMLKVDGDRLRVSTAEGTKPELSASDVERITRWKAHLMALVTYVAPERIW